VADEELRAHVKLTGDQQFKQGMKGVGDSADKAGEQIDDLADNTGHLAKEAEKAQVEVKRLIEAINETGDLTLLKALKKEKRQLRLFEGLQKELQAELEAAAEEVAQAATDAGGEIAETVVEGMSIAFKASKPQVIAGLAVLAAAASPFLGGVIASAVVGGVGLGGIAGGLALAAQDPRVKTAAEELGGVAMTAFGRAAEPFIAPAIEALDLLGRAAVDVAGTMKPAFAALAPVLLPFTQGLVGLVEDMMPGLVKGMEAARPVIRAIANELPKIGSAFGDFIGTISEDTDGAVLAFTALSDAIQVTLRWAGGLIATLSDAYEWSVRTADKANDVLVGVFGWIPLVGDMLKNNDAWVDELIGDLDKSGDASNDFKGNLEGVGDAAKDAAAELEAMRMAVDKAFGVEMDILQATMAYEKAIDDLTDSVKENGKTLDERTEEGRANRGAVLDEIQAIKDLRDAHIADGTSVNEANSAYEQNIEALRQRAIKLGLNKDEVNKLTSAFKDLPHDVEIEIRAPGLLAAINNSRELIRLLGSTAAYAAANSGSYVSGRASGGPVMAGQTYVVGENGPEILQMGSAGGTVYNSAQTAAMMSGASGGSASTVNLVVSAKPGADGPLMAAIISHLQFEVQTTGEGDAQLYFAGR
jgi:ABC-type transporter Mla subunit MlaD